MFSPSCYSHRVSRIACQGVAAIGLAALVGVVASLAGDASPEESAAPAPFASKRGPVRFSRDIRPLLSQNCFLCHGRDETRRDSGLRLDVRELALAELDSGLRAIVPGKPDESELIARVSSPDEDLRMPPGPLHEPLKPAQVELLRQWIAEGAAYEGHWSFTPPHRPAPPAAEPASWVRNPIDAFVLARLGSEGLAPAPEADRRTLIRRLSLDLTGLPPLVEEIGEFLADERPDAYEQLVDRLLASPHYGERMALDWLDAARYADTHGYHIDSHRDMWAWRDWVIQAFNKNLPFDEFTIWQIAGDLLPGATVEQQVASGFNRNHAINFEGGAIPEEYHVEYVADRVTTVGTVWMGLTLGCARCHDHKFDPITQKDFFQFFAFFNTVDEAGLDGQRGNAKPILDLPTAEQSERRQQLAVEIAAIEAELVKLDPEVEAQQRAWEARWSDPQAEKSWKVRVSDWQQLGPIGYDTPEQGMDAALVDGSPIDAQAKVTHQGNEYSWQPAPHIVDGKTISLSAESAAVYLLRTLTVDEPQTVRFHVGASDAIEVRLNGQIAWQRRDPQVFAPNQQTLELQLKPGDNQLLVKLVNYAWEWNFQAAFDPAAQTQPAPHIQALLAIAADKRTDAQAADLRSYFRTHQIADAQFLELSDQLTTRRAELATIDSRIATTMVMHEMAEPRKTHRLDRGQYSVPAEEVSAMTPASLPPMPAGAPANRLTLARWLVSPEHPLTSRVTVNRLWQSVFGVGLVKTAEDFGLQGQWPTHPELLDWLAVELMESGWDVKHVVRLIVTSSTYRQSSAGTKELYARDPENQLLARGPRYRLPAELVRDLALSASGLLSERIGGPSVRPYQPGDLWGELAHQKHNYKFTAQLFEQDHGEDLYRRTMYTFWKRSTPTPNLAAFDAPSRETCIVRRERTNTPLQALVLLNDPTFVEAARQLAQAALLRHPNDPQALVRYAFEAVTAREPTDDEVATLVTEFERQLAGFTADPPAAEALLGVGESPRDTRLNSAAHAAWTNVATVILNLDEAITKD